MDNEDVRDAIFFRLWVRLAEKCPGRVAKALAHCIHAEQYRDALEALAIEEGLQFPLSLKKLMASFQKGQRVEHHRGDKGTVTDIFEGNICVTYDEDAGGWKGEYGEDWFRIYPQGLRKIAA